MKITQEDFDKLSSDGITKKQYDNITTLIDSRFREIVSLISAKDNKGGWFVYGNFKEADENDEGFFDLGDYSENIEIGGEWSLAEPYGNYIPTRWLWTDDELILKEYQENIAKEKEKLEAAKVLRKEKAQKLKAKKSEMQGIIRGKLTPEELKYIKFK